MSLRFPAALFLYFLLGSLQALAQTAPNWTYGYVPTTAQWNAAFAAKQDYLGSPPCLVTGCILSGELVTVASTTSTAGFNVPPGTAPTSPVNGDFWSTSSGFYGQVNGTTVGPLTEGAGGSFAATSPLAVTFPSSVVTYGLNYDANFGLNGSNALAFANCNANTVLAGPSSGSASEPGCRALVGADLPFPGASSLGGVESYVAVSHQWINAISTSGVPSSTQPAFSDLSGSLSPTQCPAALAAVLGCVELNGTTLSVNGSGGLSLNLGSANTWTGQQTFVAPVLGTPASGLLTNATGLPISTGLSGAGTGVLTALGVNVGTAGAFVVNGGALGAPSSGTLTNATGLPISTGLFGAGTGVLTALGNAVNGASGLLTYGIIGTSGATICLLNGATCTFGNIIDAPGFNATTLGSVSAVAFGFNSAKTGFYSGGQDASIGLSINGSDVFDYGITTAATLTAKTAFAIADGGSWAGTISGTPTLSGANFITRANLAQVAAVSLSGNPTGSLANESAITLDSTLAFSGTTLKCTAMSATQVGCGEPDNTTIQIVGGKLTAVGASAASIDAGGATSISNGVASELLYDNAGKVGVETIASVLTQGAGISITGTNNATIALALTNTSLQANPSNPTGTSSASQVMMGMGATCYLTPTYSGRIEFEFIGAAQNSGIAGNVTTIQARYGTGTAPSNGAANAGTQIGNSLLASSPAATFALPFKQGGIITGLTPGTAYWFDLSVSSSAGTSDIYQPSCDAREF